MDSNAFGVLESKILDSNDEDILLIYEKILDLETPQVSNFGEILRYTLATSSVLELYGMKNDYFHIGGGAVLLHIANTIGIENISSWRGTHDMDIVVTRFGVRKVLSGYYKDFDEYNSLSFTNKKKISLKDRDASDSVDLDIYIPDKNNKLNIGDFKLDKRIMGDLQPIKVLGIETQVPKLHDLLSMKLYVSKDGDGLPREKDMSDILNLMGCIERNNGLRRKYHRTEDVVEYLYNKLSLYDLGLPDKLYDVIQYSRKNNISYLISSATTDLLNGYKSYIEELRDEEFNNGGV